MLVCNIYLQSFSYFESFAVDNTSLKTFNAGQEDTPGFYHEGTASGQMYLSLMFNVKTFFVHSFYIMYCLLEFCYDAIFH